MTRFRLRRFVEFSASEEGRSYTLGSVVDCDCARIGADVAPEAPEDRSSSLLPCSPESTCREERDLDDRDVSLATILVEVVFVFGS